MTPTTSAKAPARRNNVDLDTVIYFLFDFDIHFNILNKILTRLEGGNVVSGNLNGLFGQDVATGFGCTSFHNEAAEAP